VGGSNLSPRGPPAGKAGQQNRKRAGDEYAVESAGAADRDDGRPEALEVTQIQDIAPDQYLECAPAYASGAVTANFLVNRRMNKRQQMRWTRCGADLLLPVRRAVYNGTLGSGPGSANGLAGRRFPQKRRWQPDLQVLDSSPLTSCVEMHRQLNALQRRNRGAKRHAPAHLETLHINIYVYIKCHWVMNERRICFSLATCLSTPFSPP
jgi:hypothetical protein